MAVVADNHLFTGTDEVRNLPRRESSGDKPRSACVAEGVGRHSAVNARQSAGTMQARLDAQDRRAAVFDDVRLSLSLRGVEAFPTAQMSEQPRGEFDSRLSLGRLSLAFRVAVKDSVLGIDPRQAVAVRPCRVEDAPGREPV